MEKSRIGQIGRLIKNFYENREHFSCQWRATYRKAAEMPVDYKGGECPNLM